MSHFALQENEYDNVCPNVCSNCSSIGSGEVAKKGNCWSLGSCQLGELNFLQRFFSVIASRLTISDPYNLRVSHDPALGRCDPQCIGGCNGTTHLDCAACANVMDIMSSGRKNCINKCPDTLLLVIIYCCDCCCNNANDALDEFAVRKLALHN